MFFSTGFAYTSILFFMPELLGNLSTNTAYAIILVQQFCGIPGVAVGTKLVETRLGRRHTISVSQFTAALCCLLFYISTSVYAVMYI